MKNDQTTCYTNRELSWLSFNERVLNEFTSKTSSYLSSICHIPQDRIYISYFSTPYWGYDGENF